MICFVASYADCASMFPRTINCFSCDSFKHSNLRLNPTLSKLLGLCCDLWPMKPDQIMSKFSASCLSRFHRADLLLLPSASWVAGSQVYTLFSFISILVTSGACRPSAALTASVCRESGGKEGRSIEQVGTFFRGPVIFYLISQELLDYKSKVC